MFINDDTDSEGTETFTITLTNPVNAVIAEGAGTAIGTILDDEGTPRLSVSDAQECEDGSSLTDCEVRLCRTPRSWTYEEYLACRSILSDPGACQEGTCGGDGVLEFAVQLSHASSEETSVRYSTFSSSAANPRDYVATTGTLTIPSGDMTASIPVALVDDGVHEQRTETFRLVLDNPSRRRAGRPSRPPAPYATTNCRRASPRSLSTPSPTRTTGSPTTVSPSATPAT